MIVICVKCMMSFDDEFRTTVCPHGTFAANDGRNNFKHHPESHLNRETEPSELEKALDRDTQTWESIAVQFKRYNDLYEKRLHLEFPGAFE